MTEEYQTTLETVRTKAEFSVKMRKENLVFAGICVKVLNKNNHF